MNYLLIAYKPSFEDYCRNCLMASYPSQFEVFEDYDDPPDADWEPTPDDVRRQAILQKMAVYEFDDEFRNQPSATWELHIYENGVEANWNDQVKPIADKLIAEEKAKRAEAARLTRENERRTIEKRELEELGRLKEKYKE